jgi:mono/diheme cytochrome c family protein
VSIAEPWSRAVLVAVLCAACASTPTAAPHADCPAPGPRVAGAAAFAGAGDAARGERLFARDCVGCHAARPEQRTPDAPANAPRLDCSDWLAATSDAYLYDAINRGPGRFGHASLPPLGEQLAPGEVSDLVAYLRTLAR